MSNFFQSITAGWCRIWFKNTDTLVLDIMRVGLGLALLIGYGSLTPELLAFYGPQGWIPISSIPLELTGPWVNSLFFHFQYPVQIYIIHGVFLFSCAALAFGWRTAWVKWIVLILHISYVSRNYLVAYGVDYLTAILLFLLCISPIGRTFSFDRWRQLRNLKRTTSLTKTIPPTSSPWGFSCLRLIQLQMAIAYFFAGTRKLKEEIWWSGDATWIFSNHYEAWALPPEWLSFLAHSYWIINITTYGTILIELSYPFLIWGRKTRPLFLAIAVFFHLCIGTVMGIWLFSFIMILGHFAFFRREWLTSLGEWWKSRAGSLEVIYDGQCAFCIRSMASLLAFDGLQQIKIRDYRTNPSPLVEAKQVDAALYVITPSNQAIPGFDAYRYMVTRVPGLWIFLPLFYVPFFSRWIGRRLYNWIATHRHVISTCGVKK